MINLDKQKLKDVRDIFTKHFPHQKYFVNKIDSYIQQASAAQLNFEEYHDFFDKNVADNKWFLTELRDLFLNKYNEDIIPFYYKMAIKNTWNEGAFLGVLRFTKDLGLVPEKNIIKNIIINRSCHSDKMFWNLMTLASLAKDDVESAESFENIICEKGKQRSLTLLNLEKAKRIFDKRFKDSSIKEFNNSSVIAINKVFEKIETSKAKSLYESKSGLYVEFSIEADVLSQDNKLSVPKNIDVLNRYFTKVSDYINSPKNSLPKELFSISNFELTTGMITKIRINYANPESEKIIKDVFKDLLNYCLLKDGNTLKGANRKGELNNDKMFDAFMLNYSLRENLASKENIKKVSMKI